MTEEKFEELLNSLHTEYLTTKSYICLTGSAVDGTAEWGFSEDIEKIKEYFLNITVLCSLIRYKEFKHKEVIGKDFCLSLLLNKPINMNELTLEEKEFYKLWSKTKNDSGYKALKKNSEKLCSYLYTLGYDVNLRLYKDMKAALPDALEFEAREGYDDGMGFGSILYALVNDLID